MGWNGMGVGLGNLSRLADARTRSITAENRGGAKGAGGMSSEGVGAEANTRRSSSVKLSSTRWCASGCSSSEHGRKVFIKHLRS